MNDEDTTLRVIDLADGAWAIVTTTDDEEKWTVHSTGYLTEAAAIDAMDDLTTNQNHR